LQRPQNQLKAATSSDTLACSVTSPAVSHLRHREGTRNRNGNGGTCVLSARSSSSLTCRGDTRVTDTHTGPSFIARAKTDAWSVCSHA